MKPRSLAVIAFLVIGAGIAGYLAWQNTFVPVALAPDAALYVAPMPEFGEMLKSALDQVNDAQADASRMQAEFDQGAPDVNLHEVMVSLQKASLSFQTMVQVRNRLVSAYQEIMNMSV